MRSHPAHFPFPLRPSPFTHESFFFSFIGCWEPTGMISRCWSPAACAKEVQEAFQMASSPHRSVPLSWCHHDREFSTFAALHSTSMPPCLITVLVPCRAAAALRCLEFHSCWCSPGCLRLGQLDAAWLLGPFTTVGSVLTVLAPALRSRTGKTWVPNFLFNRVERQKY